MEIVENFKIETNLDGSGEIVLDPKSDVYIQDSVVSYKAEPSEGWRFIRWGGDLSGAFNRGVIVMTNDKDVSAYFEKIPTYNIDANVIGKGEITGLSDGPYLGGSDVTLAFSLRPDGI